MKRNKVKINISSLKKEISISIVLLEGGGDMGKKTAGDKRMTEAHGTQFLPCLWFFHD